MYIQVSPKTGKLRFLCSECRSSYTQRQGAWRHIRTVHKPRKCFCCEFEYARPYDYRVHLKNKHLIANPDLFLGKTPVSRGRAAMLTGFELIPQQQPVSPPAVKDQQTWHGSQLYPPVPLPAAEDQQAWVGSQLYPPVPLPAIEDQQNWAGSLLYPSAPPPAIEDQQNWAGSLLYPPALAPAVEYQQNWAGSLLDPPTPSPAVEDLRNWAGSLLYPPALPSPAGARVTSVSQPAVYSASYQPPVYSAPIRTSARAAMEAKTDSSGSLSSALPNSTPKKRKHEPDEAPLSNKKRFPPPQTASTSGDYPYWLF